MCMDCVWHPNCGTCPRVCGTRIPCCASGLWSSPCTAILGGKLPLLLSLVKLPAAHQLLGSGLMEYLFFWGPCAGKLPSNGRTCCVSLQPLSARGDRAEGLLLPGEGKCSVPQPAPPARHICASVLCNTKSQTCGEGMGGSWAAWGWEHPQPCSLLPCTTGSQRSVNMDKQAHGWATDGISSPL